MANIVSKVENISSAFHEALATPTAQGALSIFWLGQAGFALRTSSNIVLIDPYLSNSLAEKYRDSLFKHIRMMSSPIKPEELIGVDYLLATHAHSDHLDPGSIGKIMTVNSNSILICPKSCREKALERGADPARITHLPAFVQTSFDAFSLEMLPSAHEELETDVNGELLYAGYVIEIEGVRIYHSGDCIPYPGLTESLIERKIDIALLPINGRDDYRKKRGMPGNFTLKEAIKLCAEAGIGKLIPHHFGLFEFNTVPQETLFKELTDYCPGSVEWHIPSLTTSLAVKQKF